MYLSSNHGSTWIPVDSGLNARNVITLAKYPRLSGDTLLLAGTYGGGLFCSTDEGVSWNRNNLGITSVMVNALAVYINGEGTTNILLGGAGLFRSTNEGASWNKFNSIMCNVRAFAAFSDDTGGARIFAGGMIWGPPNNTAGVYCSTDYGNSWSQIGAKLIVQDLVALAAYDSLIFAGTPNGVFLSTDGCVTWSRRNTGLSDTGVIAFTRSPGASGTMNLFACTRSGLFLSTDNGLHWALVDSDAVIRQSNTLLEFRKYLIAGTSSGVWRRPVSQFISSEASRADAMLKTFELKQNYPNPFNPSTTIRFSIPMRSHVRLTIFNLLGQRIAELANEEMGAGRFERIWNGNVASGLYLYRVEAFSVSDPNKRFVDVKKMVLLK
jgi:hypothetical protein